MIFPWWAKPLAALALCAAVVAGIAWWRAGIKAEAVQAERVRVEALADLQRESNRGRARDAELAQATQTVYRDRFITKTKTEVRHATANLAACLVSPDAVGMLNRAAACAREDRPAACGAGDGVLNP